MAVATKRISNKHLALERQLRSKRDEILSRLREHRGDMFVNPEPADEGVLASSTLMQELVVGTLQREQQLLREIDVALERFDEGVYGICERCGEEIPKRRLQAVPWTRYCLKCAERLQALRDLSNN